MAATVGMVAGRRRAEKEEALLFPRRDLPPAPPAGIFRVWPPEGNRANRQNF